MCWIIGHIECLEFSISTNIAIAIFRFNYFGKSLVYLVYSSHVRYYVRSKAVIQGTEELDAKTL
jgi:hypothetical protein